MYKSTAFQTTCIMTPQSIREETQNGETATSSVHQTNACLSQRSSAMKPVNLLVTHSNLSEPYERLFYRRFEWCMHVRNWKQAAYECFKSNSVSSFTWLKSKPRIDSEILRIDPESFERESPCIALIQMSN